MSNWAKIFWLDLQWLNHCYFLLFLFTVNSGTWMYFSLIRIQICVGVVGLRAFPLLTRFFLKIVQSESSSSTKLRHYCWWAVSALQTGTARLQERVFTEKVGVVGHELVTWGIFYGFSWVVAGLLSNSQEKVLSNFFGYVCCALFKCRRLVTLRGGWVNKSTVVVGKVIRVEFLSLIEPHLKYLRAFFDWCLSESWNFAPIAGNFGNFKRVYVFNWLTK